MSGIHIYIVSDVNLIKYNEFIWIMLLAEEKIKEYNENKTN